jgi:hypothetical protein
VAECQRRIVELFQSDDPGLGRPFLIWRGEQRAIGELMIESAQGHLYCLGYAGFTARREPSFRSWFERLEADIDSLARVANPRLRELQNALIDLIHELDPQGLRYSDDSVKKA